MILVSETVAVRDWLAVLGEIREHFDPHFDFVLLPKVPLDTLDFTSFKMELGSKMIIDATRKTGRHRSSAGRIRYSAGSLKSIDRRIVDAEIIEDCLLLAKVSQGGRAVVEKLVRTKELGNLKIAAVLSEDIDIKEPESYIWGLFTRFDCERDIVFSKQRMIGISPIYQGLMGIDATWKKGYPKPLIMDRKVKRLVDERWETYWKS
jgi:4-hydroxy-3-polyprenylbenzoate decarboxylase